MQRIQVTKFQLESAELGACRSCGHIQLTEQDVRNESCDQCGKMEVYPLAELLERDELEVIG